MTKNERIARKLGWKYDHYDCPEYCGGDCFGCPCVGEYPDYSNLQVCSDAIKKRKGKWWKRQDGAFVACLKNVSAIDVSLRNAFLAALDAEAGK